MFDFEKTASGDLKMTDQSIMNMVMSQTGPGRSKAEIDLMFRLAKAVMNRDQEGVLTRLQTTMPKVGRNERCPCGSGQKYKRCCGT